MAKAIEAYRDERGELHHNPTDAVLSDIASALGRVGEEGGMTAGVARLIFERRMEIERAFADYDELCQRQHCLRNDPLHGANDSNSRQPNNKLVRIR